jgi:hypothetical protein
MYLAAISKTKLILGYEVEVSLGIASKQLITY